MTPVSSKNADYIFKNRMHVCISKCTSKIYDRNQLLKFTSGYRLNIKNDNFSYGAERSSVKIKCVRISNYPLSMAARLNEEQLIQLRLDWPAKYITTYCIKYTFVHVSRATRLGLMTNLGWSSSCEPLSNYQSCHWLVSNGLATYDHVLQKDSL